MRASSVCFAMLAATACASPKKLTPAQCDELVDRYTEIALCESFPDASAELVAAQKTQVRALAQQDPALSKCVEQISSAQHACAMRASTPDAFEQCLAAK
jgi:hypothetical protein